MNLQDALPGARGVVGLLIAAGRGRRLGGTKQLIQLQTPEGVKPLIAAAFDAIRPACREMVVVLGHEAVAIQQALKPRMFTPVLSDPDAEMLASIVAGLRRVQSIDTTAGVLLQPGDHPAVEPDTLELLHSASKTHPDRAIIPDCDGVGGHPTLMPARVIHEAIDFAASGAPGGLRMLWKRHPELCHRLPVADTSILRNLNRPEDLPT